MKKIQKLIYLFLFAMLIVIGCKRESITENPKSSEPVAAGVNKTSQKPIVIYKATEEDIAALKNAWLSGIQQGQKGVRARGGCGEHVSEFIAVDQITASSCSSSTWDIKYFIWSYDDIGSGYDPIPVSVSFTDMYFNLPISYSLLNYNASPVDPNCQAWMWDGYCSWVRFYHYELYSVPAPTSNWPADIGNFSLDLLSGFSSNCAPLTVSGDLKGVFTGPEYANMPAHVSVLPAGGPGSIYIGTDCSTFCPPPNAVCPTGGTITYWVSGGPLQQAAIQPNGNFVNGLTSNVQYSYSAILNYTIGGNNYTSQPRTGTFTPF